MATIELVFRPGVTTRVEIDDRNLLFYAVHRTTAKIPDQAGVIQRALENPIGTKKLEDLVKPDHSVVIMVDDITRPTPTVKILPHIIEKIEQVGIPDEAVHIFMAIGTHRPMTEEELCIKLGDGVRKRYRITNRDYREGDFV